MPRNWTHKVDLHHIYQMWQQVPHGQKGAYLASKANTIGITKTTLYRAMQDTFGKQRDTGGRTTQITEDYIERIAKTKGIHAQITKTGRELSTEEAIKIRIEDGDDEAGYIDDEGHYQFEWSVSAVNEALRRAGYREAKVRTRWQADYALQLWQIDSSRSKYFQIEEPVYDDTGTLVDWICRVTDRELHYKENGVRLRTWVVQSMDDHSRLRHVTYHAAPAESGMLWVEHMRHALQHRDPDHLVTDAPDMMYFDNGAGSSQFSEFATLLDALDIDTMESKPYNSEARGKVERGFRTLWQTFEAPLATRLVKRLGRNCHVRLSRISRLAHKMCVREHSKAHPWFRQRTRGELFQRSISRRAREVDTPWPRRVDADLLDLATRTWTRKVTKAREVLVENLLFEAPHYAAGETIRVHRTMNGEWRGELVTGYRKGGSFKLTPYDPAEVDAYERTQRPKVYSDHTSALADDELQRLETEQEEAEQEVETVLTNEPTGDTGRDVERPDSSPATSDAPEGMPLIEVRKVAGQSLKRLGMSQEKASAAIQKLVDADALTGGMTRPDVEALIQKICTTPKARATANANA